MPSLSRALRFIPTVSSSNRSEESLNLNDSMVGMRKRLVLGEDIVNDEILLVLASSGESCRVASRERHTYPPVGLLCLSSMLKLHGYKVEICDLVFEDFSRAGFVSHLQSLARAPVIVGICVYTEAANETLEIASLSKQAFPETKVVLGGPHAAFCYDELLRHQCVDFVVRGEGESNIVQLLQYISYPDSLRLQAISGIAYKQEVDGDQSVQVTKPSSPVTRLDVLPFPDYPAWKYGGEHYPKIFSLVTSRGCPGQCIFCASRAFSGSKYRFHSAEWVFSMLYCQQKAYGFRRFGFFDDAFLANKSRLMRFCNYMINYWPRDGRLRWACKSRVDMIHEPAVQLISEAGCVSVHLGLESGSQEVLDSIGKGITLPQVFEALKILKEYGIEVECSFMLGHPSDSLETMEETLLLADTIDNLGMGTCVFGISAPFPGTRLWEEAERLGIQIKVRDWGKYNTMTPIYETGRIKFNDLRKAISYWQHQRQQNSNPRLSGRSQEQIDFIRENFARSLRSRESLSA